jgi:GntR family transcriptional regulator / MocR family aminotransferase
MAQRRKTGSLARRGDVPLYRQIYDRIRTAIRIGQLRPGDRLPSTRAFASELSTARGTVEAAYAVLAGEGYVVSRGPAGTIVSPALGQRLFAVPTTKRPPEIRTERHAAGVPRPFQMGLPALDAFPRKLWSRVVARQAGVLSAADLSYPDPAGYAPLRKAIAAYLATARGITCTSREILITNGYQDALDLIGRVLLRRDDDVWLEDPCYPRAREALKAAGARLQPIGVDAEGLRVADGIAQARRAVFAVVTPSHQSPLGVALSLPRRLALLSWASAEGAWIVEDDYDGEFRYVGRPLPALKSLDRDERVVYAGSFSKVLFPGLRLGYLVLPEALVATFRHAIGLRHAGHSILDQSVVARLIVDGHFARHLKRMRGLYAGRRRALADALSAVFGDCLAVDVQPGGMHLVAWLRGRARDVDVAKRAQAGGFALEALSSRILTHARGQGLLLGFANVQEANALHSCRQLERVIDRVLDE